MGGGGPEGFVFTRLFKGTVLGEAADILDVDSLSCLADLWSRRISYIVDDTKEHYLVWVKANIVKLMHVTQHKRVAAGDITLWVDDDIIVMRETADHMHACLKVVCRTMENYMVTPCAVYCHVS